MVKWKDLKKMAKSMRPDNATKRTKTITTAQWTEAVKILTKAIETSTELSANEVKKLREHHRGPLANGMSQDEAVKVIDEMGWRIKR
jgi:hypothetical protein